VLRIERVPVAETRKSSDVAFGLLASEFLRIQLQKLAIEAVEYSAGV
jgi:hypothetical protein